ncbi:MAG: methyltransferase domain-containing protein [Pseudomonadota bacterium]
MPGETLCTICGTAEFVPGPKGRMSPSGKPPRCAGCGSLERHRAFRAALLALRPAFAGLGALQFSDDGSVPREAFAQFSVSTYGGENHQDMAAIDMSEGSVDVAIANHVLEHVADDIAALRELDRITAPRGLVVLSVPDLLRCAATVEYGRAREDKHGHYRIYGPDIVGRWHTAVPQWMGVGVVPRDPVTGESDRLTLLSRDCDRLDTCAALLRDAGFGPFDAFGPAPELPQP